MIDYDAFAEPAMKERYFSTADGCRQLLRSSAARGLQLKDATWVSSGSLAISCSALAFPTTASRTVGPPRVTNVDAPGTGSMRAKVVFPSTILTFVTYLPN
jgi:hypothetical protein